MSIFTSIALALGLSQSPIVMPPKFGSTGTMEIKLKKPDKRINRMRIEKQSQRFLLPVTKQTFKQNQRKERKASTRKKSRK